MALTLYTQIGAKTVFAQQHNAGDVVYVSSIDINGNVSSGTVTCKDTDWEVHFPNGTVEVWANIDFVASYQ